MCIRDSSISFSIALLLAVVLYHLFTEVVFKTKQWRKYKKGPHLPTCDAPATATEENGFSTPTCSIVEGPKRSSLFQKRKEGGKLKKISTFDGELKEILLDQSD